MHMKQICVILVFSPRKRVFTMQCPTLSTTPTHMVRESAVPALSLNGRVAAKVIRQQIKERIALFADEGEKSGGGTCCGGRVPGLGIVMANGWVRGWVGGSLGGVSLTLDSVRVYVKLAVLTCPLALILVKP